MTKKYCSAKYIEIGHPAKAYPRFSFHPAIPLLTPSIAVVSFKTLYLSNTKAR